MPYEFRTTVVQELHRPEDLQEIGRWLRGAERYFLQGFTDSGDLIREGFHPCSREELDCLLAAVKPFIPAAELRGIDLSLSSAVSICIQHILGIPKFQP